jgi:O-methyltransferase domain
VQTSKRSVDTLRGKSMFEWLDDEPEFAAVFNEGMTSASETEIEPVPAAYDFSSFGTIVDVGGGHRRLLAAVLCKTPQARGILFDAESGVADRSAVVGGSFFESVPSGGDVYVLKQIVHDWDESKVIDICAMCAMRRPPTRSCW